MILNGGKIRIACTLVYALKIPKNDFLSVKFSKMCYIIRDNTKIIYSKSSIDQPTFQISLIKSLLVNEVEFVQIMLFSAVIMLTVHEQRNNAIVPSLQDMNENE